MPAVYELSAFDGRENRGVGWAMANEGQLGGGGDSWPDLAAKGGVHKPGLPMVALGRLPSPPPPSAEPLTVMPPPSAPPAAHDTQTRQERRKGNGAPGYGMVLNLEVELGSDRQAMSSDHLRPASFCVMQKELRSTLCSVQVGNGPFAAAQLAIFGSKPWF